MSQLQAEAADMLPTKSVAAILETTEANVRDLRKRDRLDAVYVGGRLWFTREAVESYRAQRAQRSA
jgi:hypothetical protein